MNRQRVGLRLLALFGWLSFLYPGGTCVAQSELSLEELLDLHASSIGLIRTLDAQIEITFDSGDGPQTQASWRWSLDVAGDRERIRQASKKPARFLDILNSGDQQRLLKGWNPENPPELTLEDQRGVWAAIGPRKGRNAMHVSPGALLQMSFWPPSAGNEAAPIRPVGLKEYVTLFDTVEGPQRVEDDGRMLWKLTLSRVRSGSEFQHEIYLDPAAGFWVRKSVQKRSKDGAAGGVFTEYVKEFWDLGDGVYFPREIVLTSQNDSRRWVKRVANVTVNQPLPKDAFDFRFPENALVCFYPDAPLEDHVKKGVFLVWGPENRPLGSYEDVIAGRLRQGPEWLRITLAAVRLAATLVIGGLFW